MRPVAVVTGAAAGMGRAHVDGLIRSGWRVAALDRDRTALAALERELRGDLAADLITVAADVTSEDAVAAAFSTIAAAAGHIDVLVNNAGAAIAPRRLMDTSLADWEANLRLNLTGQFLCIRAVLPTMLKQGAGCIVNIATASAFTGITASLYRAADGANFVPYIAAKGGVVAMTRALARELGPSGIRVNAVAPGFTPTPRVKARFPQAAIARMVADQSLQRVQEPDDATGAVVFLASRSARFITGQVIRVDGGGSMG